jgi:hypothetical protein
VARYRSKDETDLRWNRARRRITRELDTQIQDVREELLNKLLIAAWEKFRESLETGEIVELDTDYEEFVKRALEESITITPVSG